LIGENYTYLWQHTAGVPAFAWAAILFLSLNVWVQGHFVYKCIPKPTVVYLMLVIVTMWTGIIFSVLSLLFQ
jgi:hypothetical protein